MSKAARTQPPAIALQKIPGVGPSIAQDLWDLGVHRIEDLQGADPEALYDWLCVLRGAHIDRCVLYAFRCAVYYASNDRHDPALLKWWNWKEPTPTPHSSWNHEIVQ